MDFRMQRATIKKETVQGYYQFKTLLLEFKSWHHWRVSKWKF